VANDCSSTPGHADTIAIDFVQREHIPLRVAFIGKGDAQKMREYDASDAARCMDAKTEQALYVKSPDFRNSFTTITFSYHSQTWLTTGFLGYTSLNK
jgi:hypothetical protein